MITHLDSWTHFWGWHDKPVLRHVQRLICYRYDRSLGMTRREAWSTR